MSGNIKKEEAQMNGYAIKPNMPFVTSKALKETKPSRETVDLIRFIDTHDFSLKKIDEKFIVGASKKR